MKRKHRCENELAPGNCLMSIIMDRNITKKELAIELNVPDNFLRDIIIGDISISQIAKELESALDIPKDYWTDIQKIYENSLTF